MSIEVKVPALGESVTSATIARWLKREGEPVAGDEPLVELETDKVTVEVNAPQAGVLASIAAKEGEEVAVGATLAFIEPGAAKGGEAPPRPRQGVNPPPEPAGPVARPASAPPPRPSSPPSPAKAAPSAEATPPAVPPFPAAAKLMAEHGLTPSAIGAGAGKDGRITKGDVLAFLERSAAPPATAAAAAKAPAPRPLEEGEERVRMTRLRRTIAQRLKEAQNTAAMLTTFNEVDMSAVIEIRNRYREAFEKKHEGVRLGFMSFFVRAACVALREFPAVNAEIDGEDIIYRNFVHMGIAVGGPNGLVVPVIRHAERKSFAEIEREIADFGRRAREGTLKLEELAGGTFSITNGGIYGSLMSTPILNPPQSAILGMHKIQERPVAIEGRVEIRPMMYLALTYDHRIIDGREAVSFLVRIKEGIEDPRRLLLDL
jgi:2-oxoglutarate dehydrogenase E2 component (dihydrolipoamide succinyltransferase)